MKKLLLILLLGAFALSPLLSEAQPQPGKARYSLVQTKAKKKHKRKHRHPRRHRRHPKRQAPANPQPAPVVPRPGVQPR